MTTTLRPEPDSHRERSAGVQQAVKVFIVALAVRLVLAGIFFGDNDATNSVHAMLTVNQHVFPSSSYKFNLLPPYFPFVTNWLGLAGIIDAHWLTWAHRLDISYGIVPVSLIPKLLPCVADSLVASWFALDFRHGPRLRTLTAWGYALCPLPLLISAVQGQWDSSWFLFYLTAIVLVTAPNPSVRTRRCAGVLLALGVLVKPSPILLLPLFLPRFRDRDSTRQWLQGCRPVLSAAAVTTGVCFLWWSIEGYSMSRITRIVFQYGTGAPPASTPIGLNLLPHLQGAIGTLRHVGILLALVILLRYHLSRTRLDPMATAAAVLLVVPALGGLAPQYLLWAFPFILAAGRLRLAATYAVVSTLITVAWYVIGWDLLFFLPPRGLQFLATPHGAKKYLYSSVTLDIWHAVEALFVPLFLLAVAVALLGTTLGGAPRPPVAAVTLFRRRALMVSAVPAAILAIATLAYQLGPYSGVVKTLRNHLASQLRHYAFVPRSLHSGILVPQWGSWWTTAIVWIPLLSAAWLATFLALSRRTSTATPSDVSAQAGDPGPSTVRVSTPVEL